MPRLKQTARKSSGGPTPFTGRDTVQPGPGPSRDAVQAARDAVRPRRITPGAAVANAGVRAQVRAEQRNRKKRVDRRARVEMVNPNVNMKR